MSKKKSNNNIKDTSPKIHQNSKIKNQITIFNRELTEKQKELLKILLDKNTKMVFISGPAGTAKAQPMDSDILTPSGFVKMKNILPNMEVIGEDGNPYKVISVHPQGEKDIYKVEFSDRTSTDCTLDHLWKTQTSKDRNQRKWVRLGVNKRKRIPAPPKEGTVKTTEEIMNTLHLKKGGVNHAIPITKSIEFSENSHIISPYVFGILLGDGCFRKKGNISFSSADDEIIKRISMEIPTSMKITQTKNGRYDYCIVISDPKEYKYGNIIKEEIKRMGLDKKYSQEKFIPNEYLFDSIRNRIELLRGLMDSDGMVYKSGYGSAFSTTSELLMSSFRFLVESLGGICFVTKNKSFYTYLNEKLQGLDCYKLTVCMPPHINPFFLSRKFNRVIGKTKYKPTRFITNITKIGKKECQCILVDNPSHLYLTNNCIVTHNTYTAILASLMLLNDKKISNIYYIRNFIEVSKSCGHLPGFLEDKFSPFLQPLEDKLSELIPKSNIQCLKKEGRIRGMPINYMRGTQLDVVALVCDEMQNMTKSEILMLITRQGLHTRMYLCGDIDQTDIGLKSGFNSIIETFNDEESRNEGIYVFKFDENDILRSGVVKYIIKKMKSIT